MPCHVLNHNEMTEYDLISFIENAVHSFNLSCDLFFIKILLFLRQFYTIMKVRISSKQIEMKMYNKHS